MRIVWCGLFVVVGLMHACLGAEVRQCVWLDPAMVCSGNIDCHNVSGCVIDCGDEVVRFVGRCASVSGVADSTVVDDLQISDTLADNVFCWCMMVSPVVSKWVLRYEYSSGGTCLTYCARGCANGFLFDEGTDMNYRQAVLGNLVE
ncbi:MAG: hypothetical protein IJD69_01280 [Alphaproteobacteria bacterium]|nr:hypothetical protein [Alphaproteobacteria bacterium]